MHDQGNRNLLQSAITTTKTRLKLQDAWKYGEDGEMASGRYLWQVRGRQYKNLPAMQCRCHSDGGPLTTNYNRRELSKTKDDLKAYRPILSITYY